MHAWFRRFLPLPLNIPPREWLRGGIGAALGYCLCIAFSQWRFGDELTLHLGPSLAASSVLLFLVRTGPLAQPWSFLVGNLLAASVAVTLLTLLGHSLPVLGLALLSSLLLTCLARCLHPPSVALALSLVLNARYYESFGFWLLQPLLLDSLLLLSCALLYNNLTGARYPWLPPQPAVSHGTQDAPPGTRLGLSEADLEKALEEFGAFVDVSPRQLQSLLQSAQGYALQRGLGGLSAASIMSRDLLTLSPQSTVEQAWALAGEHRLKALPVVDEEGRPQGIVTLLDLARHYHERMGVRSWKPWRSKATPVAQIMTQPVRCVAAETDIGELLPQLSDQGLHCLPVQDEQGRLVGIISQSDLIAALGPLWLRQGA